MMMMMKFCFTVAIVVFLFPIGSTGQCGPSPCKGGCYDSNGNGFCETVPAGFFSPRGDDAKYPCPAGTYSSENAKQCTPCEPGRATQYTESTFCPPCGPGEYAPAVGSTTCLKCKQKYYNGFGAYAIFYDGENWYCLAPTITDYPKTTSPTISASPTPWYSVNATDNVTSSSPTAQPTNVSDAPVVTPSTKPSFSPTMTPSTAPANTTLSPSIASSTPPSNEQSDRKYKMKAFWKFFFPWIVVFAITLVALFVWYCCVSKHKKKKTKTKPSTGTINNAPPSPKSSVAPSPTTTLGSVTLGGTPAVGISSVASMEEGDNKSVALKDLYGHDDFIPTSTNSSPTSMNTVVSASAANNKNNNMSSSNNFPFRKPTFISTIHHSDEEDGSTIGSGIYYDDMSLTDSIVDDYSLNASSR